jgi:hypothetical protein
MEGSMSTISTSVTGPVILNPTLDNHLYIIGSGTVTSTGTADGIDGAAGTNWTISNQRLVSAAGGDGVALAGSGTIENSGTGTISGGTALFLHGGSVYNGGSLVGTGTSGSGGAGVYISGTTGFITNSGSISATGSGAAAVALGDGGGLTNAPLGKITGNGFGVFVTGAAGTITNTGTISGADGVALTKGGILTNNAGGNIVGVNIGVYFSETGSTGSVTNSGSISASGTAGTGADLGGGGILINGLGASITGGAANGGNGVFASGGPGVVINNGNISGFDGVYLASGGYVYNGQSISATNSGVFITGGASTITNFGTISGATYAVDFAGSGTNRLLVSPRAVFNGKVTANASGINTLELENGKGSITGVGTGTFSNFQTVAVDSDWTLTGANTTNSVLVAGSLDIAGTLNNSATVAFQGSSGQLLIDNAATFGSNVGLPSYVGPLFEDFVIGDKIDLKNISSVGVTLSYNATTGLLQISNGASQVASLAFDTSSLGSMNFSAASDGGTGTLITKRPGSIAGLSDVFWRNSTDNTLAHWTLNGAQITSSQGVAQNGYPGVPYVGDFNGDGNADLLWRDTNGTLIDWTMNGAQITSEPEVTLGGSLATPDASWSVAGLGDFNGDGKSDVLWRNNNGSLIDWAMNGSQIASSQTVTLGGSPAAPDASWNIAGIGDFSGDGSSDILWQNNNGTLVDWNMKGSQITSIQNVTLGGSAAMPDASWSVAGIGDFNGDGKADVLWRNTNGTLVDWTMNGSQITSSQIVTLGGNPVTPDASWQIAQIADFGGDGKSDILWRNTNGSLDEWAMNGAQITLSQTITLQGNPAEVTSNWSTLAKPTDFIG